MDRISELPKEILHNILYFLSQKEVVRTSVLSKPWRNIWRTRPNLDLDFSDPTLKNKTQEFLTVVDENLQRYHRGGGDQTMCLKEFHLSIQLHRSRKEHHHDQSVSLLVKCKLCHRRRKMDHYESVSLLEKWIPLLTSMGVTEFRLSICSSPYRRGYVHLPSVVFEAESLKHLRLESFVFGEKAIEKIALCKNLRSLHLVDVAVDDDIFQKIIASCPLIETLCVSGFGIGLRTMKMNDLRNLKDFTFKEVLGLYGGGDELSEEFCSIEIHPLSLETVNISYANVWFHKEANFLDLNDLCLRGARSSLDSLSFCKFPRLKRLTLLYCDGLKESRILIDAANILYFEYGGDFVPSVSFVTNSTEWRSEIHIQHKKDGSSSWFHKLNELLKSLSQSKISLSIYQYPYCEEDIIQENIDPVHDKPVSVESLHLGCCLSSFPALVNGAFSICRPRSIGSCLKARHEVEFFESEYARRGWEEELVEYMWKILMERESGNKDEPSRLLFQDLEEASLEIKGKYDEEEEWRKAPLSPYLVNHRENRCRFVLKWRETM